jgi:PAS domain S-box-containing protein
MAAVALWSLGFALNRATTDLAAKLWFTKLQQFGIMTVPPAVLVFTLQQTGRGSWLSRGRLALLGVVPAVCLLLSLTNDAHELFWRNPRLDQVHNTLILTRGPAFWAFAVFAYACLAAAAALVVPRLRSTRPLERERALLLLVAMLVPLLANAVYLAGFNPLGMDPTPFALTISGLAMAFGVFQFRLLDVRPVARDAVVEEAPDGMLVIDPRQRVADMNPAAERLLGRPRAEALTRPAAELLAPWPEVVARLTAEPGAPCEVALQVGVELRDYEVQVTPLRANRDRAAARLVVFRDVTARKKVEAELRAQKRLFENLLSLARATAERPTLEATLQSALDVAAAITHADGGSLCLLDENGALAESILARDKRLSPTRRRELLLPTLEKGLAGWVVRHRRAALIADTASDERWLRQADEPFPIGAALAVPLLSGASVLGVLTLLGRNAGQFGPEDLEVIQAAADQLALAVRNARMFDERTRMAVRQTMLFEVLRTVGGQLDADRVAQAAVKAITQFTRWPIVMIATPGDQAGEWLVRGSSRDEERRIVQLPPGKGIIARAIAAGTPQNVPDVKADPDYVEDDPQIRSELAVPLRRSGRSLGVLDIESDRPAAFGPEDAQLAESLGEAVALALDNAYLYKAIADEHGRLRALIRSSRDGIMVIDDDGRFRVANAPAMRLLGLSGEPDDLLGWSIADLIPLVREDAPAAAAVIESELRRVSTGDTSPAEGEYEVPSRAVRWLDLPVRAGAESLGRLLVLRDVTEERALERMRDDLTHTMVHDLRNPLTSIGAVLELLEQGQATGLGPAQREMLKIARVGARRMAELVNAILDVTRLESGRMPLDRQPLELDAVIDEALALQAPLAEPRGLRLDRHLPPSLPPVLADAGLVSRVLQNLIGNAVKFAARGGRVEVTAAVLAGQPPMLRVMVSNEGDGIDPEVRGRLFQKFAASRHRDHGSGLGLAFCRLAVEAHGGKIWAESEPGKGAAFSFTLPAAE